MISSGNRLGLPLDSDKEYKVTGTSSNNGGGGELHLEHTFNLVNVLSDARGKEEAGLQQKNRSGIVISHV